MQSSSDCTAHLVKMMEDGRLEAAIVTLPIGPTDLFVQKVCEDRALICLRRDDPAAQMDAIPKEVIVERFKVLFHRDYHPVLYDRLIERFQGTGMSIRPTETYSAPSEMQYIVKTRGCFGLVREHVALDPELTLRPIAGFNVKYVSAVVSHETQQRPAIPVLAYRMAQRCTDKSNSPSAAKKPPQSVPQVATPDQSQMAK